MEWRVFQTCDSSESYDNFEQMDDVRTDVYFIFHEDTTGESDRSKLGLKIRDVMSPGDTGDSSTQPKIELKVRSARDKTGLEKWSKPVEVSFRTFNRDFVWDDVSKLRLSQELIDQVIAVLETFKSSVFEVPECLQLLNKGHYTVVRVDKKRSKRKVRADKAKYAVEDAVFRYSFPVRANSGDETRVVSGYVSSVALEGSSNVLKLAKHVVDQHNEQMPLGYPAFLSHLIHSAHQHSSQLQ